MAKSDKARFALTVLTNPVLQRKEVDDLKGTYGEISMQIYIVHCILHQIVHVLVTETQRKTLEKTVNFLIFSLISVCLLILRTL